MRDLLVKHDHGREIFWIEKILRNDFLIDIGRIEQGKWLLTLTDFDLIFIPVYLVLESQGRRRYYPTLKR